jgi:aspartate carbamoyltransferase catalytic subunit
MNHRKHLLGLEGMSAEEITRFLDTAESFKEVSERSVKKVPALRGTTVANLFFESSTRTRISFELAEKRLSADSVNFTTSGSSVSKGESLRDTAQNIEAMRVQMIVIRHSAAGAPHFLASLLNGSVINAGDGAHEHPTQGLLDMFTLRERWGNFSGKRVVIVGDLAHSRVARSNIHGLVTMGAEVIVCGPPTLIPHEIERLGVTVEIDLEKALEGADAVNVLRIQMERQQRGLFPSIDEYARRWGINRQALKNAHKECIIMHPGPMNRGIEIAQDVADGENSVILDQVTNGVAVRMAVLYLLSGGSALENEEPTPQQTETRVREGKQVA